MADAKDHREGKAWLWWLPPTGWLRDYHYPWLRNDMIAGVTPAAYAIPVSLAYASLAAFVTAALCLFAWLLRLSALVKLVSDGILVGFKAGAGLTIAMTQLPSLHGVPGGGHSFFKRLWLLLGQLGDTKPVVLLVGLAAIGLIVLGERFLPGRPIALAVVALWIIAATILGLPALDVPVTGKIPAGLPRLAGPALSASPYVDPAGARMPHALHDELAARANPLRIIVAHGAVRDLLRAEGVDKSAGELSRSLTLSALLSGLSD